MASEQKKKVFAQVLDLKDDPKLIEEYKEHHKHAWPEVLRALNAIGITRMKIFLLDTHLFMYFEANADFDPKRDFQKYTALTPKAKEWDNFMRTFQQKWQRPASVPATANEEQEWWTPMEEVFDFESQLAGLGD
eukprot:TRINITY_DN13153_c0_g1_i1.p1 TRINITY_DN13153_c0_g1~~TRINITY_DN13153_c0_g1_i1.p1  ORF type:complete len:148 (-),score=39.44 TRINITY_DN13153_c0_g1_i1:95-496(-)